MYFFTLSCTWIPRVKLIYNEAVTNTPQVRTLVSEAHLGIFTINVEYMTNRRFTKCAGGLYFSYFSCLGGFPLINHHVFTGVFAGVEIFIRLFNHLCNRNIFLIEG